MVFICTFNLVLGVEITAALRNKKSTFSPPGIKQISPKDYNTFWKQVILSRFKMCYILGVPVWLSR